MKRPSWLRLSVRNLASASFLLAFACGDGGAPASTGTPPPGTATEVRVVSTIGSAGGTVVSSDGRLELVIQAGALGADAAITVQPIASTAPGGIGSGYRLGKPDAVNFTKPVTLRFKLTPEETAGTAPRFLAVGWEKAPATWETQPSTFDAASRVLATETTHFSDWSALAGLQLVPGSATVDVGKSVRLGFRYCRFTRESDDVLCPIGEPCKVNACVEDQLSGVTAKDWAVNGVAGGSDVTGRVTGDGAGGTFVAPYEAPNPATVAVSVEAVVEFGSPTQLVSNVTIVDRPAYDASVTFTGLLGGLFTNGQGQLTFRQFEDLSDVVRFELAGGEFETTVNYPDCDPVAKVVFPAGAGEGDGTLVVNKENNAAGKGYLWNASSIVVEVNLSCGSPRTPVKFPLDLSLFGEGTYEDIKSFTGTDAPVTGGTVSWSFTRP